MNFYERFLNLCKARNVKPSRALIEAGLSKSLNTKWSNNQETVPNGKTVTALAEYFDVSVDELVPRRTFTLEAKIKDLDSPSMLDRKNALTDLFNGSEESAKKAMVENMLSQLKSNEFDRVISYIQGILDGRCE